MFVASLASYVVCVGFGDVDFLFVFVLIGGLVLVPHDFDSNGHARIGWRLKGMKYMVKIESNRNNRTVRMCVNGWYVCGIEVDGVCERERLGESARSHTHTKRR